MTSSRPYSMWSILRWVVAIGDGVSIDARLMQMQKFDISKWVTPEWFAQQQNLDMFMRDLRRTLDDCRNIGDVKRMLQTMHDLHFTVRFRRVLRRRSSADLDISLAKTIRESNVGDAERRDIEFAFRTHRIKQHRDDRHPSQAMAHVKPLASEVLQKTNPAEKKQLIG